MDKIVYIFLEELDWDRFYRDFRMTPLTKKQLGVVIKVWLTWPSQRLLNILEAYDYYEGPQLENWEVFATQGHRRQELSFWGQQIDAEGNVLPYTYHTRISGMDTGHIKAVIELLKERMGGPMDGPALRDKVQLLIGELEYRNGKG